MFFEKDSDDYHPNDGKYIYYNTKLTPLDYTSDNGMIPMIFGEFPIYYWSFYFNYNNTKYPAIATSSV